MSKKCFYLFVLIFCFQAKANSKFWLETEGLFYFATFGENVQVAVNEEISCNVLPYLNIGIGGYQNYRNYSLTSQLFCETEYRFFINKISLPLGIYGGWRTTKINEYRYRIPFVGPTAGCYIKLSDVFSLQLKYRFALFIKDGNYTNSNSVMMGFCWAFWERNNKRK